MLQECLNYIERNGPDIAVQILDHMKISLAALLIAVLIGVAGGYAASVSRRGEKWIMGLFQILRVIPSLAILVLLIPLMGVGMKPAVTALAILAIPPILTNTCVGFMEVPTFMVESAKGMGMTDREMLVHVKFPLALPMIMLIGLENLSTAMLLFAVIFAMMFIGRVPLKQLGKVVGVVVLMGALAFGIGTLAGDDAAKTDATEQTTANVQHKEEGFVAKIFHRFGTWRNRLVNHQPRPENPKDYKVRENFQVAHSNFAIASSGIFGKGPGNSVERDYLPQAFSDFIFSIIIEEMGLIGAIAVVFLYIILLFRSARISGRCENNFPAFLVMGLALLLVTQAAINMMVAVGIGPVTGQPLPLVSKGGTSTLVSCAYIGAILSVSRSAKRNDLAKETANA